MKINQQFSFRGLLLLGILLVALSLSGCSSAKDHFAIYFPAGSITAQEILQMDPASLKLSHTALIAEDDIVSYERNIHKLTLTDAGYQKLLLQKTPVQGIPLIAAVGKQPVYALALWTPLSSLSYEGVIIMQPFDPNDRSVYILTGYPTESFFKGTDPRSDQRIFDALEKDGKLK